MSSTHQEESETYGMLIGLIEIYGYSPRTARALVIEEEDCDEEIVDGLLEQHWDYSPIASKSGGSE